LEISVILSMGLSSFIITGNRASGEKALFKEPEEVQE
jgi:hypothetical protein